MIRLLTLIFILFAGALRAQPYADVMAYIQAHKQLAMDEMRRTGVPAAIKLAQGIHETSAGKSVLVRKSNNHFGIKCKAWWTGKKVYHDDDARGECFRSYATAEDSYRDHSDFLRNGERYAFLFELDQTDYKSWANGLKKAGYATNPRYAPVLIDLIERYHLNQYSLMVLGRIRPEDEIFAAPPPGAEPAGVLPLLASIRIPEDELPQAPREQYPSGIFEVDETPAVYARQGTPLLAIAQEHGIPLHRLLEINELEGEEILLKDQLVYLQRKRRHPGYPGARPNP